MKRMTKTMLTLATAWVLSTTAATAADTALSDTEIAHSAYTAGEIDIRYAHLALAISHDARVRAFAETMIRDHTAVNEAALALVQKLQVTPKDNDLSRTLSDGAAKKRAELRALDGKAFDCAYATNELGYHQVVNATVADRFIPGASVPDLKKLLSEALATFKVHEGHAARLVAGLDCGA